MNIENFLDIVRQQYQEEIREAYREHAYDGGHRVNIRGLNKQLQKLLKCAKLQGLPVVEFELIAQAELPTDVASRLQLTSELVVAAPVAFRKAA